MFGSYGIISYGPGVKAAVSVDEDIARYYRKLIPKCFEVSSQYYAAHITVVRFGIEIPPRMEFWDKYEGEKIFFEYSPQVIFEGVYYYLEAYSKRIGDIREELGLPRFRRDGCYHITIGNRK